MPEIGLMGGSFNPIHRGHVALARAALDSGKVERVLFLPTGNPPHKREGLADKFDRLRMVELAVAHEAGMAVCREEIDRGGVIYTVDTLAALQSKMPDCSLTYLIGADTLRALDIPYEAYVYSAHRTPEEASRFASQARENGFGVLIAAAGMAAHLAGAIAANTTLPVIGIPIRSAQLGGMDALLSTVQMPTGIPVATVAIDGAANAALLAAQILAVEDAALAEKLAQRRKADADKVRARDAAVEARLLADE